MKTIKDVIGKDTEKEFIGKVIVDNNHTFEGLVADYKQRSIYYIVGKYLKNNKIEFILEDSNQGEKIYKAQKLGFQFHGDFYTQEKEKIGDYRMTIEDPYIYREINLEGEIIGLEEKIRKFHESSKNTKKVFKKTQKD